MKTFKKWNGRVIEDLGCYMSEEGKSFARAFKNMLKRELSGDGIEVTDFHIGHYDFSGFLMKNGAYVYFNYSIPRWGAHIDFHKTGCQGVLYRTASGPKDYHGGSNNFCSIYELPQAIRGMFNRMEVAV